jgi:hypothetical protein
LTAFHSFKQQHPLIDFANLQAYVQFTTPDVKSIEGEIIANWPRKE